jgi:Holliday junction resolvase RusA-like endonuclease
MIQLEVYGKPEPWAAPKRCKTHSYDPKAKQKEAARWQIKAQYDDQPYAGAVHLDFTFYFPIPKGTSAVRRRQMLNHILLPTVKPDTTNMQKFYEDCLKGIVIEDDKTATDISSKKRYSEKPRTLIRVIPLDTLGLGTWTKSENDGIPL